MVSLVMSSFKTISLPSIETVSTTSATELATNLPRDNVLLCLCSDNHHCVTDFTKGKNDGKLPDQKSNTLGYCMISKKGRCYTVKDIILPGMNMGSNSAASINSHNIPPFSMGKISHESNLTDGDDYDTNPLSVISNASHSEPPDYFIHIRYGCLSSENEILFSCNGHLGNHSIPKAIGCCNSTNFCNANLSPKFMHHNSNLDAYKGAIKNHRVSSQENTAYHRAKIIPGLNLGPSLLHGGNLIDTRMNDSGIPDEYYGESGHSQNVNVMFIIMLSTVMTFLFFSLVSICCFYRRSKRQREIKQIASSLWLPIRHGNVQSCKYFPGNSNNSGSSNGRLYNQMIRNLPQRNLLSNENGGPTNSGSNTVSTNLTRLTDIEQQITHKCKLECSQQILSNQVTLHEFLGHGRFSDIWAGVWRSERIVAKLFHVDNRLSQSIWRRTVSAHRSMLLRHQTIQGLMAVDWIDYPRENHLNLLGNSPFRDHLTTISTSSHIMLISEPYQWGTLKDVLTRFSWHSAKGNKLPLPSQQCGVHRMYTLVSIDEVSASEPNLTVTDDQLIKLILRMALSLCQGLCFLHSEFAGTRGKPALAHRDLKPSNIYVRSDWSCCIGDIGLSVRSPPNSVSIPMDELNSLYRSHYMEQLYSPKPTFPQTNLPTSTGENQTHAFVDQTPNTSPNVQLLSNFHPCVQNKLTIDKMDLMDWWPVGGFHVSTPRYMAPELLCRSLQPFCFESFQKSDIYSLSLILWELITWIMTCEKPTHSHDHYTSRARSSLSSCSASSPSPSLESVTSRDAKDTQHTKHEWMDRLAYQVEWKQIQLDGMLEGGAAYHTPSANKSSDTDSLLAYSNHQYSSNDMVVNEPDVQTMRYIVCDLNLRPRLPTTRQTPRHSESSVDETGMSPISITQLTNKVTCTAFIESSSSGASSLKGLQTASTSTAHTNSSYSSQMSSWNDTVFVQFTNLLPECWATDPNSRLTALRIRKTIQRIYDQLEDVQNSSMANDQHTVVHETLTEQQQLSGSSTIKCS